MNKFLLLLMGALLTLPTFARDFEYTYEGQTLKYTVLDEEEKTVSVTTPEYQKISGELLIPSTVQDSNGDKYTVTNIGEGAFGYSSDLTAVTFPNSVTSIGEVAFSHCRGLKSVTFPNSVISIGKDAFISCSGLTTVTMGNSVTSIGEGAFFVCKALTKVEYASIESLCKIEFGSWDSNPLYYAHNLWIDGVEVKDLVIPSSVTSIGRATFIGGSGLTSVTIPNSVTSIGDDAFSYCTGLTSVTIPNSVISIGKDAFGRCSGLTSVTFPNSVTKIDVMAFAYCSGLTSVTIPNSVTEIGNLAFEYCSGLTSVYYEADEPISGSANIFSEATYETATLYMTEKGATAVASIDPWKNFKNIKIYAGIDDIVADSDNANAPVEFFNLNGVKVNGDLAPGLYIKRQGSAAEKVVVK